MRRKSTIRVARGGFTLTELLVVITILVILMALLMPNLQSVRTKALRVKCMSRMHQLGIGVTLYATEHKGKLPPIGDAHYLAQWAYLMYGTTDWNGMHGPQNLGLLSRDGYVEYHSDVFHCPLQTGEWVQNSRGEPNHPNRVRVLLPEDAATIGWANARAAYLRRSFTGHCPPQECWDVSANIGGLTGTQALYADIFTWPENVLSAHGDHVNVLYVGGHVKKKMLDPNQPPFSSVTSFDPSNNSFFDTQLWPLLDEGTTP